MFFVNYLFRKIAKLGHFLHAVAVLHYLETVCQRSPPSRPFLDGHVTASSMPLQLSYSPLRGFAAAKPGNAIP